MAVKMKIGDRVKILINYNGFKINEAGTILEIGKLVRLLMDNKRPFSTIKIPERFVEPIEDNQDMENWDTEAVNPPRPSRKVKVKITKKDK